MRRAIPSPLSRLAPSALTLGILGGVTACLSYGSAGFVASRLVGEVAPALVIASYEVVFALLYIGTLRYREVLRIRTTSPAAIPWILLTAVGLSSGVGFFYTALGRAPLSVAAPIVGIVPLVSYAFVLLLLRGEERITRRVLVGAMLVVGGVVLVGLDNS